MAIVCLFPFLVAISVICSHMTISFFLICSIVRSQLTNCLFGVWVNMFTIGKYFILILNCFFSLSFSPTPKLKRRKFFWASGRAHLFSMIIPLIGIPWELSHVACLLIRYDFPYELQRNISRHRIYNNILYIFHRNCFF